MFTFLRKTALWIIAVPFLFTILGVACNQAVLIANNDTFPVRISEVKVDVRQTPDDGAPASIDVTGGAKLVGDTVVLPDGTIMLDKVHCVMTNKTHLNWLADDFDLGNIYSIGDGFLELGDWLWVFAPFVWVTVILGKLKE